MNAGGAGSEAALPRLPAHRRMEARQVRPARASAGQGARPTSPRQRRRHPQAHTRRLPASHRRRRDVALLAMPQGDRPDRLAPRTRRRRPLDLPRPRMPELQPQRSRASEPCITFRVNCIPTRKGWGVGRNLGGQVPRWGGAQDVRRTQTFRALPQVAWVCITREPPRRLQPSGGVDELLRSSTWTTLPVRCPNASAQPRRAACAAATTSGSGVGFHWSPRLRQSVANAEARSHRRRTARCRPSTAPSDARIAGTMSPAGQLNEKRPATLTGERCSR